MFGNALEENSEEDGKLVQAYKDILAEDIEPALITPIGMGRQLR